MTSLNEAKRCALEARKYLEISHTIWRDDYAKYVISKIDDMIEFIDDDIEELKKQAIPKKNN